MLVNLGESYIVTNLQQDELSEQEKYDHFLLAQAQAEEEMQLGGPKSYKLHLPPPKLKLRVFSVSKSSNPDLYCCEHEEQEIIIGRSPNCDIRIDDELLSKMQASIYFNVDTRDWVLQDGYMGKASTNGTWLYLNEEI
jgi:hypothetical protein